MRRRIDPFDRPSMAFSAGLHALVFVMAWLSTFYEPPEVEFLTYQIELVSAPPARQADNPTPATEELVIERPDPDPTPPEPEVEEIIPVQEPEPEPELEPVEDDPTEETPPEVAEDVMVATSVEEPEEEAEETGEALIVRIEGLRRDYPEYYDNIIRQIQRCFRGQGGGKNWRTTVFFYIERDGSATGLDFVSRSGSTSFDFDAMGAVDCAGQNGRFGPLPDDLPFERFPVQFSFTPPGYQIDSYFDTGKPTKVTF